MTARSHSDRLNRMAKETAKRLVAELYIAGQSIELEAERSITSGSTSGRGHVASAPGQPPNRDTGVLDGNIETTIERRGDNPVVHVTSNAPYAAFLEFGTSRMAERPYMRPAVAKKRDEVSKRIKIAIQRVNKG